MEIEKELLGSFYAELYEQLGEEVMLDIYHLYSGMTLSIPKKIYDSKKVSKKLSNEIKSVNKKQVLEAMRKYNYSERQIYRMLEKSSF